MKVSLIFQILLLKCFIANEESNMADIIAKNRLGGSFELE